MEWSSDGHVSADHRREDWDAASAETIIHCRWEELKGSAPEYGNQESLKFQEAYQSAKFSFDMKAALEIIDRCLNQRALDQIADVVYYSDESLQLVIPHLPFDDEDGIGGMEPLKSIPTNALPFAFAEALSGTLGLEINETILQSARAGRTKLTMWMRFLCQPSFEGDITPGSGFIILDDVMTTGGTFAALRSYIVRAGGRVVASTALAHRIGINQKLAIADQTLVVLRSAYGPGFDRQWWENFGHEAQHLTEAEGEYLALFAAERPDVRGDALLFALRERIDQAAAKGG
jgi:hypothetical protein